jgi:hypothetical protein
MMHTAWKLLFNVKWDLLLLIPFTIGYMIFILNSASDRMRSSMNNVTSRWQYLQRNWDTFLARYCPWSLAIYALFQHVNDIAVYFGHPIPFQVPNGAIMMTTLGYLSNSLLNWASKAKSLPIPFFGPYILSMIQDNIPLYPMNGDQLPVMDKTKVAA